MAEVTVTAEQNLKIGKHAPPPRLFVICCLLVLQRYAIYHTILDMFLSRPMRGHQVGI